MTNHPHRSSYNRMIVKLQHISLQKSTAPDVRRLATGEHIKMQAAQARLPTHPLMSDASYRNVYGNDAQAVMASHRKANDAERAEWMSAAMDSAERFLAAWGL